MTNMNAQRDISEILKDLEVGTQKYLNHEIDSKEFCNLKIPSRLAEYIATGPPQEPADQTEKLSTEQISEANVEILRRSLDPLISRLTDPNIDPAEEMDRMAFAILSRICSYIPDSEVERIGVFIGFHHEKHQIDDIKDPAEKDRELKVLSEQVREAALDYLQSCKVAPKV